MNLHDILSAAAELGPDGPQHAYPNEVPGRYVQIDADFLAYMCSYEKEDEPKTFEEITHNTDEMIQHIRRLAGAEHVRLHLTPKESDKGGRFEIAIQKEYQGNRKDVEKPRYLHELRDWMHRARGALLWKNCEADDGMVIAQQAMIDKGDRNLSVITTKDKDLRMAQGLQMEWGTGVITDADGYGSISLTEGKTKKVVGHGTSFFWAQLLMGDSADNIAGVPYLSPVIVRLEEGLQSKKIKDAIKALRDPVESASFRRAQKTLTEIKPMLCGPAKAFEYLKGVTDDWTAYKKVRAAYFQAAQVEPFRHWQTGEEVRWQDVLVSEMKLLWMRRYPNENDVLTWLGGHAPQMKEAA